MTLSTQDLMEVAGLNTDGVLGFEAQIAMHKSRLEAVWPAHLQGSRVDNFRRGSALARVWMTMRRGVGGARRRIRAEEAARTGGMMTVLRAGTASDLREEQIETLRKALEILAQVEELNPTPA